MTESSRPERDAFPSRRSLRMAEQAAAIEPTREPAAPHSTPENNASTNDANSPQPAPIAAPIAETTTPATEPELAPAVETATEPAPAVETATEPAPAGETATEPAVDTEPELGPEPVAGANTAPTGLPEAAPASTTATPALHPAFVTAEPQAPVAATDHDYVRVPLTAHEPTTEFETVATERPRMSAKRRIAGFAAAASVGGLLLTMAFPLVEQAATAEPKAAAGTQQRLFSEVSAESMPASFAEVSAVDSRSAEPADFQFSADSVVNYPFKQRVMLTDPFGYRTAPVEQFHDAQDFAAGEGTPIYAIAGGKVLEAGPANDGCGFGLKLEHQIDGHTVTSRYCHMQDGSHDIKVGDTVKMGDPVGRVGATGMAFGAHLHLAIRIDDKPADPMPFLSKYHRMDRKDEAKTKKPSTEVVDPTSNEVVPMQDPQNPQVAPTQ